METREDIDTLKMSWLRDPCWDIYKTEGFEEHEAELRKFQEEMYAKWDMDRQKALRVKAAQLGIPDNTVLAAYVEGLENRIKNFEGRLEQIERGGVG